MSIQTLLYTPQHKHTTHTTSPITPTHRPLTQPPDAETRQISKQYFKLIQAIHHKFTVDKSVTTHTYPPGMTGQKTYRLYQAIYTHRTHQITDTGQHHQLDTH
ncbi:hypothetical protein OYC64_020193 [Pagothenia borchgrevinki]|uniref:Uncharacterized protein n=1 Tax=Pagothenia borchgrevinki TaxID=8213 RepID=A0ABD2FKM5_PAGBO